MTGERRSLRQTLRRRRAALGAAERKAAERIVNRRFAAHPAFRSARKIALYSACGAEIDVWPLIHTALRAKKTVFLPRVSGSRMHFVPYAPDVPLRRGAFGIVEPRILHLPAARLDLDLIVAPLVGFDDTGNRLGQGGGFYDRILAPRRVATWRRPVFAGAAFEVQRCTDLAVEPWDVALDFVITDGSLHAPK